MVEYTNNGKFPQQQLSFNRKNKNWRKACVDFGDSRSLLHYRLTRQSVYNMRINYDLLDGKLHMEDLRFLLNPYYVDADFIPDSIQHYPIINSKLQVLRGEESKRLFDFRVTVTNPNAITLIEEKKKAEMLKQLQQLIADNSQSDEEFNSSLDKMNDYFALEWQDMREVRANQLLNHYIKEQEIPQLFNKGFLDAMTVGEEIYQCDIVGGEPVIEKLDPLKVRILRSGYSDKIEDADVIIIEDYWSPGKIIDTYWDQLSDKDRKYIENVPDGESHGYTDNMGHIDDRFGLMRHIPFGEAITRDGSIIDPESLFTSDAEQQYLPYDLAGNIRVMKVYWKSRRKIKKVKSYNKETGEEEFNFYPETYITNKDEGEEEQVYWINEAWEGIKIGTDIYVSMRPRPVQYNRLSNPSRCHFGIIGSIYNINGNRPFSMVDIMKPYQYLYDVIHDRLNKLLARNIGKVFRLDFAKVPKGWDADKWMYYIKTMGIAVEDSFNEGNYGAATGKIAGGMNNASSGVIDASIGSDIGQYMQLLDALDSRMGAVAGISRQREGQISNRETVGGVERATLQSSHITEWLFFTHDSVKKRALECLLETAKIAMKGKGIKKFEFITTDGARKLVDIDGDEFAECDYGLVLDNSNGVQELNQKLDMLAQAALQNQLLDFSTIMKLYTSTSLAEKQRMVEHNEQQRRQDAQQQQQQEIQLKQQEMQQNAQFEEQKKQMEYKMHQEDNETKILVANINSKAEADRLEMMNMGNQISGDQKYALDKQKLEQSQKQFEATLKQNKDKLDFAKQQHQDDIRYKKEKLNQSK